MPAPNLAISLNATTDEVRDRLMPVNSRWPIAALLDAARRFPLSHGRRVTFEYVLLAGRQRQRRRRRPAAKPAARDPDQGQPHPLESVRRPGVPAPLGRAHPHVSGAAAPGRAGGLHPHAARRRHRRRLRPAGRARRRGARSPAPDPSESARRCHARRRYPERTEPGARSGHRHLRAHRRVLGLHPHHGTRLRPALSVARAAAAGRYPEAARHLGRQRVDDAGGARGAGAWSTGSGCAASAASTTRPRPTSGR